MPIGVADLLTQVTNPVSIQISQQKHGTIASQSTRLVFSHDPQTKLAAIFGLAEKYANPELGRYLAGLWEQDIFRGLAWTRVKPGERTKGQYMSHITIKAKRTFTARAFKPPLLYRVPSWSWGVGQWTSQDQGRLFLLSKAGSSCRHAVRSQALGNGIWAAPRNLCPAPLTRKSLPRRLGRIFHPGGRLLQAAMGSQRQSYRRKLSDQKDHL
jgi:hypothetical protein